MKKEEISALIRNNHDAFNDYMLSLSEGEFMFSLNGDKWTAGQEIEHIMWSVKMLANALLLPKFFISWKFGVANRPSKTYDVLMDKYIGKLKKIEGSFRLKLDPVPYIRLGRCPKRLQRNIEVLCRRVKRYSEDNLDRYILPHCYWGN